MSKNKGLGLVSALAVGAGVAAVAAGKKYKTAETKKKEDYDALHNTSEYRNTERGKYEKNSKGIYYTNGNYEAFARPRKPEGVDDKHAYIVGSGLASLAAACFLVRDGQMPGKNIHILEAMDIAGGACDGIFDPSRGYVMRGGREMENHFECLWDLFRSIPSIETPGVSVLDEYYWLNKEDPNYSLCRATKERGKDAHTDGKFNLSQKGCMEIMKLFMTKDEDLYDKTIEDVFDEEVFDSTFWLYWRTMFAFENWHSALEMKLYFQRFIHHISGLPDFSALKFTKYNQYESLILPMQKYLEEAGVEFQFNTEVTNVLFEFGAVSAQFCINVVDQSVWQDCSAFEDHLVCVFITVITGLGEDRNWCFGNGCAVFVSNNFAHQTFCSFCNCVQDCLGNTVTDCGMQSLAVNFDCFHHFGQFSEVVCFFAYQSRFDIFIDNWDEVLSQEQRVTAACTGVLNCCTVAPCNLSVFQNQHNRDGLACLTDGFESRSHCVAKVSSTVGNCSRFDCFLVVKEETCTAWCAYYVYDFHFKNLPSYLTQKASWSFGCKPGC